VSTKDNHILLAERSGTMRMPSRAVVMQTYDTTLKLLLKTSARRTLRELIGAPVVKWLDIHIELQSRNDPHMAPRMAEYKFATFRLFGKLPRQLLLYVGEAPLRMQTELRDEDLRFRYRAVDIRSLNGGQLLASDALGDNVIAVLTRLRIIKKRSGRSSSGSWSCRQLGGRLRLQELTILAGLRPQVLDAVRQEVREMPIELDIRDHPIFGPPIRKAERKVRREAWQKGMEEGRQEGRQEGEQKGRQHGELAILRRQLEKRFGPIPKPVERRLASKSTAELEDISVRFTRCEESRRAAALTKRDARKANWRSCSASSRSAFADSEAGPASG